MSREQEIDSLPPLVDGAVEVFPLALDLDVSLVHPPTLADRALLAVSEIGLQLRSELLDPAAAW
jgi:hypothetical protein